MDLFRLAAEMGHERVLFCSNPEAGLRAVVAIHSTVLGPGLGGVRMWPYATTDEAVVDALRLARGMTYKAAAAGVQLGGAKAVILGDPKRDKSEALFRAFGRAVESLAGHYITAEDVGTGPADMEWIAAETRWVTGLPEDRGGGGDPSPVTARGVHSGVRAAALRRWGNDSLAGRSVAIQGLGSVGSYLASYLAEDGAKVFGCDVDGEACAAARDRHGVEIVPHQEIFDVGADIFSPCALGAILRPETIARLKVEIVAGGANNQLAEPARDGDELHRRGILYAPDFIINAGGVICGGVALQGEDESGTAQRVDGIFETLQTVYELAESLQITTAAAAERFAEQRLQKAT